MPATDLPQETIDQFVNISHGQSGGAHLLSC